MLMFLCVYMYRVIGQCSITALVTLHWTIQDWLHWVNLKGMERKWSQYYSRILLEKLRKPQWRYLASQWRIKPGTYELQVTNNTVWVGVLITIYMHEKTNHKNILKIKDKRHTKVWQSTNTLIMIQKTKPNLTATTHILVKMEWVPVQYFTNCNIHHRSRGKVKRYEL
jgi:hypothetical protein